MTGMDMPLPEPLDYCYEWDGPYGSRKFSAARHNGRPPDRSVAIYSADQLRARDAQWRAIVGPFFASPPVVEHFDLVTKSA